MASADRCDRCLELMTRDTFERPLATEVIALRAENERLRKAARAVVEYEWKRTDDVSFQDVADRVRGLTQAPWKNLVELVVGRLV